MRPELEHVAAAERGQGRGKRPSKARTTEKASRKTSQQGVHTPQEAVHTFKRDNRDKFPGPAPLEAVHAFLCEICLAPMKPGGHGQRKRFCSAKCRRLACFARQVAAALEAGKAEGVRDIIERLKA